jgi:hypothetical protein
MSSQYGFHSYYSGQEPDAIAVTVQNFLDSYSPAERILQSELALYLIIPFIQTPRKKKKYTSHDTTMTDRGEAVYVSNG